MALILVTGSSAGLGLNTAIDLAARGHAVVVHARDSSRRPPEPAAAAWNGILYGDLADLDQVRDVAHQAAHFGRFDTVVHNAGALHHSDAVKVNTIAPYALTALMDKPARLIYLSSSMHRGGSTNLQGLETGAASYGDSKLWVTALAHRWPTTTSHAVDPGWVPTRMGGAHAPDDLTAGHQTQLWLATHPDVTPVTGGYWYHKRVQEPDPSAADEDFQARLLAALESHTGIPLHDRL
ncbi:NAD(P)-dependent dehydrogenase (short-subunit alcohol dehydrogenase family) [Microbacterium sp. BE35]|uniref:SDR family NAD(P)-dependent oxidoreductase n=1 Tax=Microbacterium sp. BE35 TaxID=2817773 RepID=UPI0028675613|nr:SDR family NAD(P)-dependent oxidoreductase [Microbacterium sp. BE35]MDR7190322.1 NAD(P)-dependent dehydrogenase (short-subunit alcohol dehydrogenase family) [Microbacterium sp. BE35]